ncbi:MAG TPA: Trk system potassium transporter TrkA, partial [Planctomycetota bacterium]|nr:Trk system potassium transporter TrkA [Planctomycetota bacterium]
GARPIVRRMDIVIVGAGEVGLHLADVLSRERHRVRVVDSDPDKVRRVRETLDVQALDRDGTAAEALTEAGTPQADLFVAVTDDDRTNMLACVLARGLGASRVILRVKDTTRLEGFHYFYKRTLGYDAVLATDELAAEEVLNTVREQHALEVESFADGRVQLRRLRLREASELTSAPLSELELPGGLLVAAIQRQERFFVAHGGDRLEPEDQVYLIGRAADLDQFELLSGARKLGRRSVVVMGGGRIGARLVQKLEGVPGVSVRVLERDPARAREISTLFGPNVMVLVGDAMDLDLLHEERIDEANVFIAATGDDEDNIMACQLAKSHGVERTVALVNKPSYIKLYDLLGIDFAISPRLLCANRILRVVRAGSINSVAVIGDGRAEILEIEARLRAGRGARKVKNLSLPRGVVIAAVVHGEDVVVPRGDTPIHDGDRLIVFTLPEHVEELSRLFRESEGGGGR